MIVLGQRDVLGSKHRCWCKVEPMLILQLSCFSDHMPHGQASASSQETLKSS